MLWMTLKGNPWFLKHKTRGSGSFGALSQKMGFAKNKNILFTILHSDDLIIIKTVLWVL